MLRSFGGEGECGRGIRAEGWSGVGLGGGVEDRSILFNAGPD